MRLPTTTPAAANDDRAAAARVEAAGAAADPYPARPAAEPAPIEWDLAEIYPDLDAWRADKARLEGEVDGVALFAGRLGESAVVLADALDAISATEKDLVRLHVHAFLRADEDRRVAAAQERRGETTLLLARFEEAASFVAPELLRVGSETVGRYLEAEPRLARHAFNVRNILRREPHTMSAEAEAVMAGTSAMRQGPERVFAMLSTSDMPFPTVTLSSGEEVRLDQSAYGKHRASRNRADRKLVFDAFWTTWQGYAATLAQTLDTHVKAHAFEARARRYGSALEAALAGPNIPTSVYRTLLAAADRHLPSLHRYFRLRRRMLGVDELRYYDIYPTLVASDLSFGLDEAKSMALASAAPLGDDYVATLRESFAGDWMHVYPREGKAPGAYMYGAVYDVHPYLLLNYNGAYDDVSTFVHEWGHAMHTVLAKRRNPYETASYATFTAEIASITNEVLLQEHLLAQDLADRERLFYLGTALEAIRGTFFRQVMFAEFELAMHERVERGEALSGEKLNAMYEKLVRRYHGSDAGVLAFDPTYAVEWAFVPHFYTNFYVFQYATSIAGGTMFAARLLDGDEGARRDYLAVLEAGGSRYAYELLREHGIDLASDAPYDALIARMDRVMDEIEAILDRQPPHSKPNNGGNPTTTSPAQTA